MIVQLMTMKKALTDWEQLVDCLLGRGLNVKGKKFQCEFCHDGARKTEEERGVGLRKLCYFS